MPGWLQSLRRRVVEAMGGSLMGDSGTARNEDRGWSPITARAKNKLRDLDIISHMDMVKVALYLYAGNALARWLVTMPVSLTVGQELGYSIAVNSGRAQMEPEAAIKLTTDIREVLDKFWYHPAHDLAQKAPEYARTYLVTGHLILPVSFVNKVDGIPHLDIIDAQQIKEVDPLEGSSMVPGAVRFMRADQGGVTKEERLEIIQQSVDGALLPEVRDTEKAVGACLYFRNNLLLNSMRGVSYLMDVADWLDALDQFTWITLDRAKLRNAIVWHLKLKGMTAPQIETEVNRVAGLIGKPGTVYGSNENAELEAKVADIGAAESTELGRMILTHILGSKGFPESWYSQGGNSNRATAAEQTDVAYKAILALQNTFRGMFRTMLWMAYDSAQDAQPKRFPKRSESPWLTLEPDMPVIAERDMSRLASATSQLASAFGTAVEDKLISRRTARTQFLAVVGKTTGGAIAIDEEEAQIAAEEEEDATSAAERAANDAKAGFDKALADPPEENATKTDPAAVADGGGAA